MSALRTLVTASLALVLTAGCTDPSCYDPPRHDYAGELRELGALPEGRGSHIATLDRNTLVAVSADYDTRTSWAWRVPLDGGEPELFDSWRVHTNPAHHALLPLPDGRLLSIGGIGEIEYVLLDPERPMSAELYEFVLEGELEHLNFAGAWRDPATDAVYVYVTDWLDGNQAGAEVLLFEPDLGKLTKLGVRIDGIMFNERVGEVMSLCDGRVLLPGSSRFADAHNYPGDSVLYFDPAVPSLEAVNIDFTVRAATPLDQNSVLLVGRTFGESSNAPLEARVLDTDTAETRAVELGAFAGTPNGYEHTLLGLADGTALNVDTDGALALYSPDSGFAELGMSVEDSAWALELAADGRVLVLTRESRLLIYE